MEMTDFRKIYLFIRRLKGWSDVYYDKSNTLDEFLRYLLHMLFYEGTTDLASWAELVESNKDAGFAVRLMIIVVS